MPETTRYYEAMPWGTNRTRNSLQQWPLATIPNNIAYNLPNNDEDWVAESLLLLIDPEKANLYWIKKKQTKTPLRRPALLVLDSLVERYLGLARSRQSSRPAPRHNKWTNQSVSHLYRNRLKNLHPKRRPSLFTATIYECSDISITKSVKFTTRM